MDVPNWDESEPVAQSPADATPSWDDSSPVSDEGAAMAFGRGALRNFPLAQQVTAASAPINPFADKSNYSDELSHLTQAAEQSKAQHQAAYDAGAVTGSLAPLALPVVGEAGEGAAAALGAGENAIAGGAVTGAEQAISDTNLRQHPVQAAKQAAIGAGIGGATGAALNKAIPALTGATEQAANKSAVQSTIWNRNYLGHLEPGDVQDIGQFMRDHGIVDHNTEQALGQAKIIKTQYGELINQIGAESIPLKDPRPYLKELADKAATFSNRKDPVFIATGKTYDYALEEIKDLGQHPTFAQLQEVKDIYGTRAFNSDHSIKDEAAADIYFLIRDMMKQTANEAPSDYASALKGYSYSTAIEDGLEKKMGSLRNAPQGIGMGSISRVIQRAPGPARAIGGAAALASGHPIFAAAAALPEIMNPALQSQAYSGLARALPKMAAPARLELANTLESKFGKKVK